MTSAPDLLGLLSLDPRRSRSPFGGYHRNILIAKDFTNAGDFVFNTLLQHFGRREPNTQILMITLSHDWMNYSASSAKCGFNLRRTQNLGNIDVLNIMEKFLELMESGDDEFDFCNYIQENVSSFIEKHSQVNPSTIATGDSTSFQANTPKPLIIMIDDLSILLSIGSQPNQIYRLISNIDRQLRTRSKQQQPDRVSHLIVQTMITNFQPNDKQNSSDNNLNQLISNIENICDMTITLKPLNTGYSTRVDGTIKIVDNRLPATLSVPNKSVQQMPSIPSLNFPNLSSGDIGSSKAYFFKLGDRRVRLTSTALIF